MTVSPKLLRLDVGWTREDEDGWWIIDRADLDVDVPGFWIMDKHGNEKFVAATQMGDAWEPPL